MDRYQPNFDSTIKSKDWTMCELYAIGRRVSWSWNLIILALNSSRAISTIRLSTLRYDPAGGGIHGTELPCAISLRQRRGRWRRCCENSHSLQPRAERTTREDWICKMVRDLTMCSLPIIDHYSATSTTLLPELVAFDVRPSKQVCSNISARDIN
jgi:hypothetical protein